MLRKSEYLVEVHVPEIGTLANPVAQERVAA
jgi:hypothetical protein